MIEPFAQHIRQRQHARDLAVREHIHVERNAAFKLGQLEQRFHHQFRINRTAFRLDDNANIFRRFVANVLDQWQFARHQQFGDLFNQPGLLHLPGNFRDDDTIATPACIFLFPTCAYAETTAASAIGFNDRFAILDNHPARGQVWPLNKIDDLFDRGIRMLDEVQCRIAKFSRVVWWNGCRHAHGNSG